MNSKRADLLQSAFALILCLLAAGGVFLAAESSSAGSASDLDYFKGTWTVKLKANPQAVFHWSVKEDLRGSWLNGVVELNGEKISTDFWRQTGGRIERFAFTADGTFVRLEGSGWESNRLILTGTMSDKTGETKIRETITKLSDREFSALWERMSGGKWTVFSDELCSRQ